MTPVPQLFSFDQSQTRYHPVTGIEPYHSAFPLFYDQKNQVKTINRGLIAYSALFVTDELRYQIVFVQSSEMEVYEYPLISTEAC